MIAFSVEPVVEGESFHPVRQQPYVADRPARCQAIVQRIAVLGAVGQKRLARPDRGKHVRRRAPIMH